MPDPTNIVPFWQTIIAVIASGVLGSFLTVFYDRKKQNKEMQLSRLEKAISYVRVDHDELQELISDFENEVLDVHWERSLSVNMLDIETEVLLCAPGVDNIRMQYSDARRVIIHHLQEYRGMTRDQLWPILIKDRLELLGDHNELRDALIRRCRRIIGVKEPATIRVKRFWNRIFPRRKIKPPQTKKSNGEFD